MPTPSPHPGPHITTHPPPPPTLYYPNQPHHYLNISVSASEGTHATGEGTTSQTPTSFHFLFNKFLVHYKPDEMKGFAHLGSAEKNIHFKVFFIRQNTPTLRSTLTEQIKKLKH